MKKYLAIFSAIVALAACAKEAPVVEEPEQGANQELKVNFTVSLEGVDDTKATVKKNWADKDVIFVLFSGVEAPKYLEMKYDISSSTWESTPMNYLTGSDLANAAEKKMTLIYLPYGSKYEVADDGEGNFTIKDKETREEYSGHYYYYQRHSYTYSESTISITSPTITLTAPYTSSYTLVHFDITGYDLDHTYVLNQDYVRPLFLTSISANGTVTNTSTSKMFGCSIPGYIDSVNGIVSFSGLLDGKAVGNLKTYRFLIHDEYDGTAYFREINADKTISTHKYIGIGDISDTDVWTPVSSPYFSVAPTQIVSFAQSNLAYMGESGAAGKKWQLMQYPWSYIETNADPYDPAPAENVNIGLFGWATSGYQGKNPWMTSEDNADYGPAGTSGEWTSDSESWDWGRNNTVYNFGGSTPLAGTWRTETKDEWMYVLGMTANDKAELVNHPRYQKYTRATVNGIPGIILLPDWFDDPKKAGASGDEAISSFGMSSTFGGTTYTSSNWNTFMVPKGAIFLPAAGMRGSGKVAWEKEYGYYYSSTIASGSPTQVFRFLFSATLSQPGSRIYRCKGHSVRLIQDLVPTTVSRGGSATAVGFDFSE